MKIDPAGFDGMKVTVMGLGLNGGGLASARYLVRHGARVTVTDLRDAEKLQDSMERLSGLPVRYVLGKHEEQDFTGADLVIKNPAVPTSSPFLEAARSRSVPVETDLSIFLSIAKNPIIGVTGSKGKSTTASAIAFGLARVDPGSVLAGNITVSPLDFVDGIDPHSPVVLELSSWQLGDLRGRGILAPAISAFTMILPDHLDRYAGMGDYIADKKVLFQGQTPDQKAVFNLDDPWQREFPRETKAQSFFYSGADLPDGLRGAWLDGERGTARLSSGGSEKTILSGMRLAGVHNAVNLLCAGLVLQIYGVKAEVVRKALAEFPGIEHRLEMFREWKGIRFYNDSAATIPQATVQAVLSIEGPTVLIMGGTDKNIDFSPLARAVRSPRAIVLLEGTATEKIRSVLDGEGVGYEGPFVDLAKAVEVSIARAGGGTKPAAVLFSPGCTSFGMFRNEF
ncbi:MAG TPA: UDP-N-acetylmuramoyl-L-alanine--D-glutamate ligase, partial [Spirochaetia bacterium]|nr:UDP-N-acetylmuramoyl-L-alanine--D-glutamate ligase [Spirochaetia bacterium]